MSTFILRIEIIIGFTKTIDDNGRNVVSSAYALALCPVPDEKHLYLRMHPTEPTRRMEQCLPSRDFLMSSYPWFVFSIDDLAKIREYEPSKVINNLLKDLNHSLTGRHYKRNIEILFLVSKGFRSSTSQGNYL